MTTLTTPLSALPLLTLDPAWFEQSQSWAHADPRMAKARMAILLACWRGVPAASVPMSKSFLAATTGLQPEEVVANLALLTEGMEVRDTDKRIYHVGMAALAEQLFKRYDRQIQEFALAAAMAAQAPEQFSLVAVETARVGAKGKTSLPKDMGYQRFPQLVQWAHENGWVQEQQRDWIMEQFRDFCSARSVKSADWAAEFRVWAFKEKGYGRGFKPGSEPPGQRSAARGPYTSRQQATRSSNDELLRRRTSSAQQGGSPDCVDVEAHEVQDGYARPGARA